MSLKCGLKRPVPTTPHYEYMYINVFASFTPMPPHPAKLQTITSFPKFVVLWERSVPPLLLNPFKLRLEWTDTWFSTFILFFESLLSLTLDHFSVACVYTCA